MNSAFNKSNTFKIVLLGPNGVGKSSIITRYCDNKFDNKYYSTVGVDYRFKSTKFDEKDYKVQIWDTAGQERYQQFNESLFKSTHGIILVFDLTSESSFQIMKSYLEKLKMMQRVDQSTIFIVGNKSDMEESREYSLEQQIQYVETTVKSQERIDMLFQILIQRILNSQEESHHQTQNSSLYLDQLKFEEVLSLKQQHQNTRKKHQNCC